MRRRDVLRIGALSGAAALGASAWTRRSGAATFGDIPTGSESSMVPENLRVQNVLECHLSGGFTPWDSFYAVPGRGEVERTFAYATYDHLIKASEGCGFEDAEPEPFEYFARDSVQEEIFFGPYMKKLIARPDVMKRLRVVITRHAEVVPEGASALVYTGRGMGHPSGAGLATHINRYFTDRDVSSSHAPPFAYDFGGGTGFTFNGPTGLVAQGLHPGSARPLQIRLDALARLQRLLGRATVGTTTERQQSDALMTLYFQQYQARLRPHGAADALRAPQFEQLRQAFSKQTQSDIIGSVALEADVQPWMTPAMCQEVTTDFNTGELVFTAGSTSNVPASSGNLPAMGLRVATHLLTHPTHPARYCSVTDGGVKAADGGGGYDSHSNGPWRQAINFNNLIEHLLGFINKPGEANPRKLNLDKTLVILSTEFGRAPGTQTAGGLGRNHWPHGFAQIYIGGPIREGQAGCYGSINDEGIATTFTTAAENRIAALLALGIYPFDEAGVAFVPTDVQRETGAAAAARSVTSRIFGLSV